jgi:hypothetical protein
MKHSDVQRGIEPVTSRHGQRTQPVVDGRTQLRRASKSAVGAFAAPAVRTGICFRKAPVAACSAQTQSQHQQCALAFASGKHVRTNELARNERTNNFWRTPAGSWARSSRHRPPRESSACVFVRSLLRAPGRGGTARMLHSLLSLSLSFFLKGFISEQKLSCLVLP